MNAVVDYLADFKSSESLSLFGPCYTDCNDFSEPIIFVDGGTRYRQNSLGLSVGDGDSCEGKLDLLLPKNKDYSDFAYVLQQIPNHFKMVKAYGFLGGRKDHEWCNFAEAYRFVEQQAHRTVQFDKQVVVSSNKNYSFSAHTSFSLFVFKDSNLQIEGDCEFSYSGTLFALSSHGLSNVSHGKVSIKSDQAFILFLT